MPRKKKKKNSRLGHEGGRRHERIKAELRAMAAALKPGMALPRRAVLLQKLDVARVTLTRAVQALDQEGILEVRARHGVFTTVRAKLTTVALVQYWEPYILDSFDQALIGALTQYAPDYGLFMESTMLGSHLRPDPEKCKALQRAVAEHRYAALVSMTSLDDPAWRTSLAHLGVPLVFNPVAIDHASTERLGVEMLQRHGATKIAYFGWDSGDGARERFKAAMDRAGLEYPLEWLVCLPASKHLELTGYRSFIKSWKRWPHKPDALLSNNDRVSHGIMQAILDLGLRIPQDLQLATHANKGVSDFPVATVLRLEVDIDRMARMMLEKVRDKIKGAEVTENTPLELSAVE